MVSVFPHLTNTDKVCDNTL